MPTAGQEEGRATGGRSPPDPMATLPDSCMRPRRGTKPGPGLCRFEGCGSEHGLNAPVVRSRVPASNPLSSSRQQEEAATAPNMPASPCGAVWSAIASISWGAAFGFIMFLASQNPFADGRAAAAAGDPLAVRTSTIIAPAR